MSYVIRNCEEVKAFLSRNADAGFTCIAIKGPPTPGDTYSDGTPITGKVNVAWLCEDTGEMVDIVYGPEEK